MKNDKELLFSVTADDCKWEYYRASGKGGQHRNKTDSAVRVTHPPSGAVSQSCDERSQWANYKVGDELSYMGLYADCYRPPIPKGIKGKIIMDLEHGKVKFSVKGEIYDVYRCELE